MQSPEAPRARAAALRKMTRFPRRPLQRAGNHDDRGCSDGNRARERRRRHLNRCERGAGGECRDSDDRPDEEVARAYDPRQDARPRRRFGTRWAEGTFWVGEYRARKIHQIDPETGTILRTIESNRF